jgi:hypothetical protein
MAILGTQSGSLQVSFPAAATLTATTVVLPTATTIYSIQTDSNLALPTAKSVAAIYTANATTGKPETLVATTGARLQVDAGRNTYTFGSPPNLAAGTYALAILSDQTIPTHEGVSGGKSWTIARAYTSGMPATFPGTAVQQSYRGPIFASFQSEETRVTKATLYTVLLAEREPIRVQQSFGYAVVYTPPRDIRLRQTFGYAVVSKRPEVAVQQTYGYVVLDDTPPWPIIYIQG